MYPLYTILKMYIQNSAFHPKNRGTLCILLGRELRGKDVYYDCLVLQDGEIIREKLYYYSILPDEKVDNSEMSRKAIAFIFK